MTVDIEMFLNRPMFTEDLTLEIPKKWICNLRKKHGNLRVKEDSPDSPTETLTCLCVQCMSCVIETNEYVLGKAVPVSHSYEEDYIVEHYVGVYLK